jgi:formamidopyrimidine-DNA glycosylase
MPELPEVETVVRGLQQTIVGEIIVDLEVPWQKALEPDAAYDSLVGKTIQSVTRRAKFVLINFDIGALVVHLRMTGKLTPVFPEKWITVILHFESGNALYFQDMRKFGRMLYTDDPDELLNHLGPEPLEDSFTSHIFHKMLMSKQRIIKPLLLDQTFVVGLGNIYVDEALFQAGIHPESIAKAIPKKKTQLLYTAIRQILAESIKAQGTTVLNFSHGDNQSGTYQAALQVYGRKTQACQICRTPIEKIKLAQRGTHYCPKCQRKY